VLWCQASVSAPIRSARRSLRIAPAAVEGGCGAVGVGRMSRCQPSFPHVWFAVWWRHFSPPLLRSTVAPSHRPLCVCAQDVDVSRRVWLWWIVCTCRDGSIDRSWESECIEGFLGFSGRGCTTKGFQVQGLLGVCSSRRGWGPLHHILGAGVG